MHKASASRHRRGSVLRSVPPRLRDTTGQGTMKYAVVHNRANKQASKFGAENADTIA